MLHLVSCESPVLPKQNNLVRRQKGNGRDFCAFIRYLMNVRVFRQFGDHRARKKGLTAKAPTSHYTSAQITRCNYSGVGLCRHRY
jgi:hypothetical protein